MLRKLVTATVSAALCLMSAVPAMAQDYRFTGFDAPRGASATLNLRVPMGREQAHRATYGLTVGFGQTVGPQTVDGRTSRRLVRVADIRFSGAQMRAARVASFDLANLDRGDPAGNRRMNLTGGFGSTTFLLGAVAAAAAICFVVTDCFGDDDEAMPN